MEIPVLFIFTHDSIGVGEDGPTHQPVEQLAAFRAMPNMLVFRPGDANEVTECYKVAMQHTHGPSTLVFSRQAMPTLDRTKFAPGIRRRQGRLRGRRRRWRQARRDPAGDRHELQHCMVAWEKLKAEGIKARVVSMPCWEIFDEQDAAYKESVLPAAVTARVSIEMAAIASVGTATSGRRAP